MCDSRPPWHGLPTYVLEFLGVCQHARSSPPPLHHQLLAHPSGCSPAGLTPAGSDPAPTLLTLIPDLLTYVTNTGHLLLAQAWSFITLAS